MCEKVDLSQKACCTSAKIMLFVVGGGEILVGIILAILAGIIGSKEVKRDDSGWFIASGFLITGIFTIIVCFYSAKWFVILNYVWQILVAIDTVVVCIIFGLYIGGSELIRAAIKGVNAKAKTEELDEIITLMYVIMAAAILGSVFSIMAGVLYAKILCCGGGGGSRSSSFSSGTS